MILLEGQYIIITVRKTIQAIVCYIEVKGENMVWEDLAFNFISIIMLIVILADNEHIKFNLGVRVVILGALIPLCLYACGGNIILWIAAELILMNLLYGGNRWMRAIMVFLYIMMISLVGRIFFGLADIYIYGGGIAHLELYSRDEKIIMNVAALAIVAVCVCTVWKSVNGGASYKKGRAEYINMVAVALLMFIVYLISGGSGYPDKNMLIYMTASIFAAFVMIFVAGCQRKEAVKAIKRMDMSVLGEMQKLQIRHKAEVNDTYYKIKSIRHDIYDQMDIIRSMIKDGRYEEGEQYVEECESELNGICMPYDTGNLNIDAILSSKRKLAQEKGIRLNVRCEGRMVEMFQKPMMVDSLFSNIFNNAIEACERLEEGKDRYINAEIICRDDIILNVVNSSNPVNIKKNRLITSKRDPENHGIGMRNIEKAADELNGILKWDYDRDNEEFYIAVSWSDNELWRKRNE